MYPHTKGLFSKHSTHNSIKLELTAFLPDGADSEWYIATSRFDGTGPPLGSL